MTMTQEERISKLEGAYEVLAVVAANMVTKDELRAAIEGQKEATQAAIEGQKEATQAAIEGQKEATQAAIEGQKEATQAAIEGQKEATQAAIGRLRAEVMAEIRASELRITLWNLGAIFTAATIIIAVIKLWP